MPMKQCNAPGCRALIPFNETYCDKHKHAKNVATYRKRRYGEHEGKYQRFYQSAPWKRLSRLQLENQPYCVECYRKHVIRKADIADHVIPIRDDWSKRLNIHNLQSLCIPCHNRKTMKETAERTIKR